jgi:hypothetical protein
MCRCSCEANDVLLGAFACGCPFDGRPLGVQSRCCGGATGFDAWCARAGTTSASAPTCTSLSAAGEPTGLAAGDVYAVGNLYRCVDASAGCAAGCNSALYTTVAERCASGAAAASEVRLIDGARELRSLRRANE